MTTRERLYVIVFESDTTAGKVFDIALLIAIASSVAVVMLDSVQALRDSYHALFVGLEWFFTLLFTVEYAVAHLLCAT